MLVFIDESGCAGFKLGRGSTPFFVVVLVIFDDLKEAERVSAKIGELRSKLGIKTEFKFSKSSDDCRTEFFTTIADADFRIRAIVIQKDLIRSEHLKSVTSAFYNYVVRSLLKNSGGLRDARIKIDGSGDRKFRRELNVYLRQQLPTGSVRSVKFANSKGDHLVQLADMCAGAIARSFPVAAIALRTGKGAD